MVIQIGNVFEAYFVAFSASIGKNSLIPPTHTHRTCLFYYILQINETCFYPGSKQIVFIQPVIFGFLIHQDQMTLCRCFMPGIFFIIKLPYVTGSCQELRTLHQNIVQM